MQIGYLIKSKSLQRGLLTNNKTLLFSLTFLDVRAENRSERTTDVGQLNRSCARSNISLWQLKKNKIISTGSQLDKTYMYSVTTIN